MNQVCQYVYLVQFSLGSMLHKISTCARANKRLKKKATGASCTVSNVFPVAFLLAKALVQPVSGQCSLLGGNAVEELAPVKLYQVRFCLWIAGFEPL